MEEAMVLRRQGGCGQFVGLALGKFNSLLITSTDLFSELTHKEVSTFLHACEGDAVTKLTNEKVPYFNAPIYLQNKTQIGKVDEIFGPINESYFSVKMMEGIIATSYNEGDKFYIDPMKLLPLSRFLPQPKGQSQGAPRGGGRGGRGGGRGRGGSFRGGRGPPRGRGGPPRGGGRGGFRGRGRF
ncbi:hypothetical protein SEVIR_8G172550v4 [Setaria viridis]